MHKINVGAFVVLSFLVNSFNVAVAKITPIEDYDNDINMRGTANSSESTSNSDPGSGVCGYDFTINNCPSPKILGGDSCSYNGIVYYELCTCNPDWKDCANFPEYEGKLIGVGESCTDNGDTKFASCRCADRFQYIKEPDISLCVVRDQPCIYAPNANGNSCDYDSDGIEKWDAFSTQSSCVVGSVLFSDNNCYDNNDVPSNVSPKAVVINPTDRLAIDLTSVNKKWTDGDDYSNQLVNNPFINDTVPTNIEESYSVSNGGSAFRWKDIFDGGFVKSANAAVDIGSDDSDMISRDLLCDDNYRYTVTTCDMSSAPSHSCPSGCVLRCQPSSDYGPQWRCVSDGWNDGGSGGSNVNGGGSSGGGSLCCGISSPVCSAGETCIGGTLCEFNGTQHCGCGGYCGVASGITNCSSQCQGYNFSSCPEGYNIIGTCQCQMYGQTVTRYDCVPNGGTGGGTGGNGCQYVCGFGQDCDGTETNVNGQRCCDRPCTCGCIQEGETQFITGECTNGRITDVICACDSNYHTCKCNLGGCSQTNATTTSSEQEVNINTGPRWTRIKNTIETCANKTWTCRGDSEYCDCQRCGKYNVHTSGCSTTESYQDAVCEKRADSNVTHYCLKGILLKNVSQSVSDNPSVSTKKVYTSNVHALAGNISLGNNRYNITTPAATYCHSKGNGWYLPVVADLQSVLSGNNLSLINNGLTAASGVTIDNTDELWSVNQDCVVNGNDAVCNHAYTVLMSPTASNNVNLVARNIMKQVRCIYNY